MASLRGPSYAPSLAVQWLTHMKGLVNPSPTTVFPRLNPLNQSQARFNWTLRVTAFEQAMQELYGDAWKERLNSRQISFVTYHERAREKRRQELQKKASGAWAAPSLEDDKRQPESEWRRKVEKKKADIRWQTKLASFHHH